MWILYKSLHNFWTTRAIATLYYKQIDPSIKKIWNEECSDVKKTLWDTFVNFSYKLKQGVFRKYKYCTVSQKYKTASTTKQTPKPNCRNECLRRACIYCIKCTFHLANSTKIIILLKHCAQITLINAIQTIRKHYQWTNV